MKPNTAKEPKPPLSGSGTLKYVDGTTYTGECQNGKPHGKGKRVFSSGSEYDGEWANGRPHGHGKWTIAGRGTYVGDIVEGQFCGRGIFYGVDDSVYVGEWLADKRDGFGRQVNANDSYEYTGEWVRNKRHGTGRQKRRNGDVYEGQFENGKRHGVGKYTVAATGKVVHGRWENGKRVSAAPAPPAAAPPARAERSPQVEKKNGSQKNGDDGAAGRKSSASNKVTVFGAVESFVPTGGAHVPWAKGALLGSGVFAEVYAGELPSKQAVAVKIQRWPRSVVKKEDVTGALEEARVLLSCVHPNIVKCYGGERDLSKRDVVEVLIFSEKCQCSLDSKEGKLTMAQVREYTSQILKALVYLHGRGIVHRDLKPANVLLSESGVVKVADFGVSKDTDRRSVCNTLAGTFVFIAPEVLRNRCTYGREADIWSLGCMVLSLLGHSPWGNADYATILNQLLMTENLPAGVPKDCPPRLKDFLSHCFDRKPEKRWTAAQLLEHRWLKDGG